MLILLEQTQLPQALDLIKLRSKGSASYTVEGFLQGEIGGRMGLQFYVDEWPHFTTIFFKAGKKYRFSFLKSIIGFHTINGNVMKRLFKESDVLKNVKEITISNWTLEYEDFYKELFQSLNAKTEYWSLAHVYFTDAEHLKQRTLPEGYADCDLTEADAELLNESWEHKNWDSLELTKFHLRHFPSVGVKDKEENLVAWEVSYFFGAMGMLFVLPEHRNRGIAQYVVYKLSKKLLESGMKVFCYVEDSNEGSKKLHKKCGFYEEAGTETIYGVIKSD